MSQKSCGRRERSRTIGCMGVKEGVNLEDIARSLRLSISTVSRALRDHPGLSVSTKARVLAAAKDMGYQPNLAARLLVSGRKLRIAIITPTEIRSVYDLVRKGIRDEAEAFLPLGVELVEMTFPRLGRGETKAFGEALKQGVDGLILVPGSLLQLAPFFAEAASRKIPVLCLLTDAPDAEKLCTVAPNAHSSGALAGEIMGRMLPKRASVAVTTGDLRIVDHRQKFAAFKQAILINRPDAHVHDAIENRESETLAYESALEFLRGHASLSGLYISTGNGAPVLRAVQKAAVSQALAIISTNLYPELVPRLRDGVVLATLYERPYSHGQMAFRMLYNFIATGEIPPTRVSLEPFLVMRGNLDGFLQQAELTDQLAKLSQ